MAVLLIASALAGVAGNSSFQQIDFGKGSHRLVTIAHGDRQQTAASQGGRTVALPTVVPTLPARNSRFSTLFRARDILDLENTPARSVAKLFRMTADNKRSPTACTAQFIGPRHLLTAGHCIVDRSKGVPHPGFEVASRFDLGASPDGPPLKVTRAWVPADQWIMTNPLDALVTPEKCSDFAVIETDRDAAPAVGWLALRAAPADGLLHRFSYPHRSAADTILSLPSGADPASIAFIEKERADTLRHEAEFSPANLYYEYGMPDVVERSYFAERNGYSLPGRSGSALVDTTGAIVALLSRTYEGATYNCRLTPAEIGAIAAIVEGARGR
jgi:hypothetical protein